MEKVNKKLLEEQTVISWFLDRPSVNSVTMVFSTHRKPTSNFSLINSIANDCQQFNFQYDKQLCKTIWYKYNY